MTSDTLALRRRVKWLLWFFIVALVFSGLTAFPIKMEMDVLQNCVGEGTVAATWWPEFAFWISFVHRGVSCNSKRILPAIPRREQRAEGITH